MNIPGKIKALLELSGDKILQEIYDIATDE